MRHRLIFVAAVVIVASAGVLSAADWPQWRGPQRDGVAPSSPPLADAWPPGGPKKVWESEKIPAGGDGGLGSPVVSGGKVFLIMTHRYAVPIEPRKLTDGGLRQLGWTGEKLPEDLSKAVEEARASKERADLKQNEVGPWADKWVKANVTEELAKKLTDEQIKKMPEDRAKKLTEAQIKKLTEDQAKRLGDLVRDRLVRGAAAIDLAMLDKLATIKDKEFPSQAEIDKWFEENGVAGDLKKKVMSVIATTQMLAKDYAYCLDASDGKTLWKKEYPGSPHDYGASSTPCVVGDRVYLLGSDGDVYCLSARDGEEIWKGMTGRGDWNSSFVVVDGKAIVLAGPLYAFDAATGTPLWTQKKVSAANNSPVVWAKDGKNYLVCNTGGNVACVDPADGKVLWTCPGGSNSTAAVVGDYMAVLSENKNVGLSAYKLTPEKAEKLWSINGAPPPATSTAKATTTATTATAPKPPPALTDRGASPIISKDCAYATAGGWSACVELQTGKIAWYEKTPTQEIASPILADGKIYCMGTEGKWLIMVQATPENCRVLGKTTVNMATCSSPAFADGRIYLRLNNSVTCYDLTAAGNPASAPATAPAAK